MECFQLNKMDTIFCFDVFLTDLLCFLPHLSKSDAKRRIIIEILQTIYLSKNINEGTEYKMEKIENKTI